MSKKARLGQVADADLRLLRVFRAVTECGGMTAAELELGIGRSTISRHIKDLETRLGLTLCHRGRGGFSLTKEGHQIYDAALRLMTVTDEFRHMVDDIHDRITGTLNIVLFDKIVNNPESKVHQAIQLFIDKAPDVQIEIYVEELNSLERGILDGRFQIGIAPIHNRSRSLDYHYLFKEQMYLYCGHKHPHYPHLGLDNSAKIIRSYSYAGLGYHSYNMDFSHKKQLHRKATAYDQEGIAVLLFSGRYLAFLPQHYAEFFVDKGFIRKINNNEFQYTADYAAIVRHAPKPSRGTNMFLRCLIKVHSST